MASQAYASPAMTEQQELLRNRRDRRLSERRQVDAREPADRHARGGRPRDAGRHARPQGARLRVARTSASCSSTRAASTSPTRTPLTKSIADQAREAVAEADLVLFIVDAQIGITPGDEEVAQILRESKKPVLVIANKIDDPKQEHARARAAPARARRPDPALRPARPRHGRPARRDRRLPRGARPGAARASAGRHDPRRDPRPPERRQVDPRQQAARPGARDRLGDSRHDARLDRHRARSAATRRSCSSTPPAFAASAATGRASSTTRSCARSRRRSAPTSRSS